MRYEIQDGFVHIPEKDFRAMQEKLENMDDVRVLENSLADQDETFPFEIVERLLDGESPVKVFRNYRGLTQEDLASRAGTSQVSISDIESGKITGSVKTLKAIAGVLEIDLDDIT